MLNVGLLGAGRIADIGKYLKEQDVKLKGLQDRARTLAQTGKADDDGGDDRVAEDLLDRIVVQRSRDAGPWVTVRDPVTRRVSRISLSAPRLQSPEAALARAVVTAGVQSAAKKGPPPVHLWHPDVHQHQLDVAIVFQLLERQ